MKNEKQKDKANARAPRVASGAARDWRPLFARLRDATEWALDIAHQLARDIGEDVDAVERTRGYVHAWIEGRPVKVDMNDILTTLAVLFAAIEIDLGFDSSPVFEALALFERMLHLPGAWHDALPTVIVRTPLRRRNASVFPHLAA